MLRPLAEIRRTSSVFGQSAGAWVINKLMISPLAHGLFHAAIAQSGGDMGPMRTAEGMAVLADAEKSGIAFARTFGAPAISELRQVAADRIAASDFDGLTEIPHSNAALPIVDGYVIPGDTFALYAAGKHADVPLLLGYNADEGAYMVRALDTAEFTADLRERYGTLADGLLELLPTHSADASKKSQERLWAESVFGWQMWAWARTYAQTADSKVFFYYYSGKQNGHGAELPYVFQHPFMREWQDDDRRIAGTDYPCDRDRFREKQVIQWIGLPHWPTYSSRGRSIMRLGEQTGAEEMPDVPLHSLWTPT